jgi:hypothetical protein
MNLQTMCFVHERYKITSVGGLTLFPCLGPEFVAALLERSVKKADGPMTRRPTTRHDAFSKLTTALKKAWQKKTTKVSVRSRRRAE